jgi:hypothetical protein
MKIRKLASRFCALVLAVAAAGCDNPFDNDAFQREELARARSLWSRTGASSYSFTVELQCNCAPNTSLLPVSVTVKNGQVTSRVYKASPNSVPPADVFGAYDTVEELFAVVEDAINRDANVLQVGYHDQYGFPEVINVSLRGGTPNDQRLILVTDFALTPG